MFLLGTVSKVPWLNDNCWTPFTRIWINSEFKCATKSCLNDNSLSNSSPWLGKMIVSWVLNHLCLMEMMLYCRTGREGRCLKTNPSNAANVTGDSVGLCFLSWGPKCFCKSQRTAEHAAIMSLTRVYQELAPKLTCCILNSPLFFLIIGKKFLLPFYEVNCPLVLACVHLLACMQGRSLSVPSCAWQHMCHQSHGCWALLCCVGHIAMTGG